MRLPQRYVSAQAAIGGYGAKQTSFTTVEVTKGGEPYYSYKLKGGGERIYSATLFPPDKLIVGTSSKLELIDLPTKAVLRSFTGHAGIITSLSPCPQNGMFLSAGNRPDGSPLAARPRRPRALPLLRRARMDRLDPGRVLRRLARR